MIPHKLIVRLHATSDPFGPADFVPVFHRWIQTDALPGHLLIDVADYAHVPDGPGTLLVASEANVHMDRTGGRLGLAYVRKRPAGDDPVAAVLAAAVTAADLMEREPSLDGRLRFDPAELVLRFNDRLLTPNTPAMAEAVVPLVRASAEAAFGRPVEVAVRPTSPSQLLELSLRPGGVTSVSDLRRASGT